MSLIRSVIADTDVAVSALGLGTVKLGRDQGVKYPQAFRIPDDKQVVELLSLAQDLGINLLDTAPAYGRSEARLGDLLKNRLKTQRHQWVISSKAGEEFVDGCSMFQFTPEHLRFSLERSLKRLSTDYLDIFLIHSNGEDEAIIQRYGALEVLADFKQQGLIRASGMSTKSAAGGLLALQHSDCAMVTYRKDYTEEAAVLDYASAHNRSILVKKALASGHLCQGTSGEVSVQENMRFIFDQPCVASVIVGTIDLNHLKDNVGVVRSVLQATGR